ncbi:MAG: TetR/AcrR family transcriptional regulator C-terminal ligand-binding domain-containing protein [Streptosporangiaceae bacterium]
MPAEAGPVTDRAVKRREAPAGTDAVAVARTISAPLLIRVLVTGEPLDDQAASEAAATALAAITAGVFAAGVFAAP